MTEKGQRVYRYGTEIGQMCHVFGERDLSEPILKYIEDLIRTHLIDLLVLARTQALRRGSRHLAQEDLLFHVRNDKGKLKRLRTYLSWKDVRKKSKELTTEDDEGIETLEEPTTDRALKVQKMAIPISWDPLQYYSAYVEDGSESESDEEDDGETGEDSPNRLRSMDALTKAMTKEEYLAFAEYRQASFTYRKAKRFKDFLNIGLYVEGNPSDEVIDVLGFFAYEMVATLCDSARNNKERLSVASLAASAASAIREEASNEGSSAKRKKRSEGEGDKVITEGEKMEVDQKSEVKKTKRSDTATSSTLLATSPTSPPRILLPPTSLFSAPAAIEEIIVAPAAAQEKANGEVKIVPVANTNVLDKLDVADLLSGYAGLQRDHGALKMSGMRNWRAGPKRLRTNLL